MTADDALAELSAAGLQAEFAAGRASPIDAAEAVLARIACLDPLVNAFVHVDAATTRAMAEASAARWRHQAPLSPLDGVPVSIKDLVPVAGWPLRRGSRALLDDPPSAADSPPVARLREAGAVFIGKTATSESGSRIVCRSAVHGVTRNPYDLSRTPGGSSGGAAAALALGMGTLALGTDGAGSIRIPSAFCNLVGLKPGFGRVPAYPPSIFMPHSVIGPMARRVADVAAMTAVLARPDPRDPFAWPSPFDAEAIIQPLSGLRVALSPTLGTGVAPDDATLAGLRSAARALAGAGAAVEEIEPAWPVDPYDPFMVFWEATYAGFMDGFPPERAALMDPLLHAIAARGRRIDILAWHRALAQRLAITDAAHAFFRRFHLVLAPVMPSAAFDIDAEAPPGAAPDDWRWCPYTYLFNMTGQPALGLPAGFTVGGLPIGVQLGGPVGSEPLLLAAGAAIEASLGLTDRRPGLLAQIKRAEPLPLVACGSPA
jgi:aspartyl-tRNA(Asn)/glutamyl-tRNA(Gln) amidotransferase subunit A